MTNEKQSGVSKKNPNQNELIKNAKSWLESNNDKILKELEQMVATNSFTPNSAGSNLVISHLETVFSELSLSVTRIPCHSVGDVLVADSVAVRSKPYFILSGHIDTVHSPESSFSQLLWQDGKGFGPGVLDMKGGVVVFLWALRALAHFGKLEDIPVRVIINSDEETGSLESLDILTEYASGAEAALVFEHGRNGGAVITQRKGVCVLELEAFGKSGHAGNAHQQGRNAIVALSEAILKISELTDYKKGTTISVGIVRGGTTTNTIPDYAIASFDLRYQDRKEYERVISAFEQICQQDRVQGLRLAFRERVGFPAMIEDAGSRKLALSFVNAAKAAGIERSIMQQIVGGGSDASRFSDMGIPSIDGLGPIGADPHTDNEHIEAESVQPCILALVSWIVHRN